MATAEFSEFAGILSATLSQHHLLGLKSGHSTGIPLPSLALFIVILPMAHLNSHSSMSGSWINQGKLEMVRLPVELPSSKEMARVNIDILGISELKWTGMGEFNSDDHYIYYCGQGSLRRDGVTLIVNKSPKCGTWMESLNDRMICVCFQGKPFSIIVIQVYAPTTNAEEAEVEQFCEDL